MARSIFDDVRPTGAKQDERGAPWALYVLPRRGEVLDPSYPVNHPPPERTRLLMLNGVELRVIDPCPPNWRDATMESLIEQSELL